MPFVLICVLSKDSKTMLTGTKTLHRQLTSFWVFIVNFKYISNVALSVFIVGPEQVVVNKVLDKAVFPKVHIENLEF